MSLSMFLVLMCAVIIVIAVVSALLLLAVSRIHSYFVKIYQNRKWRNLFIDELKNYPGEKDE